MISSARRDKCTPKRDKTNINSTTKSRSETLSSAFKVGSLNFNNLVVICLLIGKDVPASAPDPRGF